MPFVNCSPGLPGVGFSLLLLAAGICHREDKLCYKATVIGIPVVI